MQEITSTKNPAVKKVSSLLSSPRERRREGLFVVEGPRMAREIPPEFLRGLYMTAAFAESADGRELLAKAASLENADAGEGRRLPDAQKAEAAEVRKTVELQQTEAAESRKPVDLRKADSVESGVSVALVSDEVLARMSGTEHPQGVLALVDAGAVQTAPAGDFPAVFLEDVQDPGNIGTIIRTAEAAGISAVYMSGGCADILSPKVVRATMGCLFRMPLIRLEGEDFYAEIGRQQERGQRFVAAALGGTKSYDGLSYDRDTAFLIGNEGNGLSARALALADERVLIPMEGQVESLNAAIAAAILMYEAARQRRSVSRP